jgi:CDP-diacylglycerol pyrophosphatase
MRLSEFKNKLRELDKIKIDGVPDHFHITEIGIVKKEFIDCGGTNRSESSVTFQLWVANDKDHRLTTEKLLGIIGKAEKEFLIKNLDVEVEYQKDTIGKYGLTYKEDRFFLTNKQTDCLAKDKCGIEVVQDDCCSGQGCC